MSDVRYEQPGVAVKAGNLHLVFKAADRWVPGLDVGKVTGGWRDLPLSDVRYEQPGVAVKAGNLHL
ncbi:hypothetical protein O5269_29030, partial [Escherichia coli]|nr:hypothetical protein [Escherichia coli]